jgi:cytolysin-activating lysine-acyltransferase
LGTQEYRVTTSSSANGIKAATAAPGQAARRQATLGAARQLLQLRTGQLMLAAARLPRYRDCPLKSVMAALFEPLKCDRVAFAQIGDDLVGMAVWASVSDSVADKIARQVEAATFPLDLAANEWNSGERIWLVDLIVPNRAAGTAVFANFSKLIGDKPFRMFPAVAQSLEPHIVQQINALGEAAKGGPARDLNAKEKVPTKARKKAN